MKKIAARGNMLLTALLVVMNWQIAIAAAQPVPMTIAGSTSSPKSKFSPCNFRAKPIRLKTTRNYGIFGNDEFDTLVCGYLFTREEKLFDESVTIAYFRILKAADRRFINAIRRGIKAGNSVNFVRGNSYYFNLGCIQQGKIKGETFDRRSPYLTDRVERSILASTSGQPIGLVLSFGKHIGSGCECCNLAHQIRLYE
jgi:hypothetical protein